MPEFQAEHSSNVGWARYNESTRVLEVDFKDSKGVKTSTYAYDNFPGEEWATFQGAPSKGKYFAFSIRPKYKGRKL